MELAGQTYGLAIGFVLIAELGAFVAGRFVMELVFGEAILQYYTLLYWAILATGINALVCCGSGILVAMGCNRAVAVSSVVAMGAAFFLSEPMVRLWGITGAAYALTIAYLLQVLVQLAVQLYRLARRRPVP